MLAKQTLLKEVRVLSYNFIALDPARKIPATRRGHASRTCRLSHIFSNDSLGSYPKQQPSLSQRTRSCMHPVCCLLSDLSGKMSR